MSDRESKNEKPARRRRGRPARLVLIVEGNLELPEELLPCEFELLAPYLSKLLTEKPGADEAGEPR